MELRKVSHMRLFHRLNGTFCIYIKKRKAAQWQAGSENVVEVSDYQQNHVLGTCLVSSHTVGSWRGGEVAKRGPVTGRVTRSFSHPLPEEGPSSAGQASSGGLGRAELCIHLFVFLEKYASWRCEVWKELSHLAEGTRKIKCLQDLQTGMFL